MQIFKYFFFIGALVGLINSIFYKFRINKAVKADPELKKDAGKVLAGVAIFLAVPYLLIGLLQLAGGFDTFLFIFTGSLSNVFVIAALAVFVAQMAISFYWVFFKSGVKTLISYKLMRSPNTKSETYVKIYTIGSIISSLAILALGRIFFGRFVLPF